MTDPAAPLGLSSSILTLAGLFARTPRFTVPRYQRAYAWSASEVGRLMEDLLVAFGRDAPYYFVGTVTLILEPDGARVVVDGQQRLATFTILFAALRARVAEPAPLDRMIRGEGAAPRLLLRPADRAVFGDAVRDPGGLERLAQKSGLPDPQAAMAEAAGVIATALEDLEPAQIEAFATFLRARVTCNCIETTDREGAPRLFLVLNETGGDLSAADLVKAELFERADLTPDAADAAAQRWDELLNVMGRKSLDELLSFMPAIARSEVQDHERVAPRALHADLGALRRGFLDSIDPAAFLADGIYRYADALLAIRRGAVDAGMHTAEVNRRIKCLQLLQHRGLWLGAAVAYVAEQRGAPERLLPFFEGLERLAFACFLAIVPSHRQHLRFSAVLKNRDDPTGLFGPGGALELTAAEKRRMIARINEPFKRDPNRRRIVAMRVNAALQGGEALAITDDVTVEHILPENPDESWLRNFPDEAQRELWTHLIGNFALLPNAVNRICGARSFAEKRRIYFDAKRSPPPALTRMLREAADWTPNRLIQRHETLVQLLAADWSLV